MEAKSPNGLGMRLLPARRGADMLAAKGEEQVLVALREKYGREQPVVILCTTENDLEHIMKVAGHHGAKAFIDTLMGDLEDPSSGQPT